MMEDLYYIPIELDGEEYFQQVELDQHELEEYHISNYQDIISEYFEESDGIVNLKNGRYKTKIFIPKDKQLKVHFCLINKDNYPSRSNEIDLDDKTQNFIRAQLSLPVKNSEGIYKDQIIDIISDYVTPRLKFANSDHDVYYDYKFFNKSFIIFGAPGAGKTTLLKRLTIDYLNNEFESKNHLKKFPIYIQLRDYNRFAGTFENYLNNCIKNTLNNLQLSLEKSIIDTGNLYLMLDGADEIDYEKFKSFKNTIVKYKKKNPYISFIITSRPDRSFNNINHFDKCYVEPFNKSQIKELTFRKLGKTSVWKEFISILNIVPEVF